MNQRTRSLSWILTTVLLGVVVLVLVLLLLTGSLPVKAALLPIGPGAISNPQKAAILGAQNLLQLNLISHGIYLPLMER